MLELATPIAVVCHDAGATNLILGWLKASGDVKVQAFMEGPAKALWCNAFPDEPLCDSLEDALQSAKTLLSGTGWASALEHRARQLAHARGIHSVAVLDHWVNYVARFEREGQVQWPSEVWVADAYALALARRTMLGVPVRQLDNLYLSNQVAQIGTAPNDGTVLVVLEPVRNTWGRDREGEFQALDYFFECLTRLYPCARQVLLRQHPSEPCGKYQPWLRSYPFARMGTSRDVAEAISQADVVVGVESFALTIALAAGRPVYSSLPPWAPAIRLPHKGIRQIRHLTYL